MVTTMPWAGPPHTRSAWAKVELSVFNEALTRYHADVGSYPPESVGLGALWSAPDTSNWHGPYLTSNVPLDPWGRPYIYHYRAKQFPEILSYGADGRAGGEGMAADISNFKLGDSRRSVTRVLGFVAATAVLFGYLFLPWFLSRLRRPVSGNEGG